MAKQHSSKATRPPPTPKTKKPWDIPPFPKVGDATLKDVYCAVGEALTDWEKLDRNLAAVFALLISGETSQLAPMRAYGSIVSARGRVDLVRAACSAKFAERPNRNLRLRLQELLDEAEAFAARRNDIAHGIAAPYRSMDDRLLGYALAPAASSTRKARLTAAELCEAGEAPTFTASYIYTSIEMKYFGIQFTRLRHEAVFVTRALREYIADPSTVFGNERFGRPTSPQKPG